MGVPTTKSPNHQTTNSIMAIFNDLKKILFGAKAVSQSAAEKTVEAGKEATENIAETGGELWEKTKEKVEQIGAVILDKAGSVAEKAGEFTEAVGSKVLQAKEVAKDKLNDWTGDPGKNEDVMDDILAETKTPPSAASQEDEMLDLPVFAAEPADQPKQAQPVENEPFMSADLNPAAASPGTTVVEKSNPALEKAADIASKVGEKVLETGSHLAEKFGEKSEQVGSYLFEKGGEAMEKAKDIAEDVGTVVLQKGGEAFERAKDFAGDLGEKFRQAKDDLFAKAQAEAEKEGDTDSLIEKAKNLSQKLEDKITGNNAKFADKPMDVGGSELNKHGSFWEKADRFAKGDYHNQGERLKPGEIKIEEETLELKPIKKSGEKGEGLIDDAIIDDDK